MTVSKQSATPPALEADGEDVADASNLGAFVGMTLKRHRLNQHLTIQDVSELSGVSRGMISRIENDQATPSLDALQRICQSLGVSMSNLFKDFDIPDGGAKFVPRGQGMDVARRGTKRGHSYELLSYDQGPKKLFEPFLITLDDESELFPRFQHEGTEFIYMLEGRIEYRVGKNSYVLEHGDAISFQGKIPHGPDRLIELPIKFLSTIHYAPEPS
ncbi:MAG: transcriptional regulator with XRE-family HTH domain [Gammaproteobacteria bacterium]